MSRAPIVITVSDLRRDTARLIERARRSGEPFFVTQRGYVTAVLLSRGEYDTLCILRDCGLRSISPRAVIDERQFEVRDGDATAPANWKTDPPAAFD